MSRKGDFWAHAPQKSFFGHMKDEIDISKCTKYRDVKAIIDNWMDLWVYNNRSILLKRNYKRKQIKKMSLTRGTV